MFKMDLEVIFRFGRYVLFVLFAYRFVPVDRRPLVVRRLRAYRVFLFLKRGILAGK